MRAETQFSSKSFAGTSGEAEHFIAVTPRNDLALDGQLREVEGLYAEARQALGLGPETAIFRRVFMSDAMNQAAVLRDSALYRGEADDPVAVSLIQQAPLAGAKLALLAYHVESAAPVAKRRLSPHHVLVERNGRRHLWTTGLCAGECGADASPSVQTRAIFGDLIGALDGAGATLRDHCVRTWIYLKDVDVFYQGMVESRGAIFAEQGMTRDTHYIASTGIEGACAHRYDLVTMDAYSHLDLEARQVSYLNDFERLCATKDYNVHFERGTRIAYADRAHHFLSGTASIDKAGQIVHPGDVLRQLDHALANAAALLRAGAADLADLMHLVVYLRDPTDHPRVAAYLAERFPDLPTIIVQGAVCRPQWLIEVEGIAIAPQDAPSLPAF
ncbi:MAG TPA: Rid family hydrolase [Stellaceae bacterium]|nr:Rid family hydrolase [Stellaceae bacterium]